LSNIGVLAVIGLIVIILALVGWIAMTVRASRNPTLSGARDKGNKRGDNTGGVVHGSPAQQNRRDEAPRTD
jgi:hypothetical protein